MMNICITGEFSTHIKFSMLSFLIVLYAFCGIQGKAFPSRYKRNYEASYHYIPFEEGMVRIPAGYSPENFPNYQDYIHGYVQTNGHDWPVYYHQSVPSQSIQDPYSNVNGHHKTKAEHTWHFIDQTHVPITQYRDGTHQFESGMEVPNDIEAHVKKEVIGEHGDEYDVPADVEALHPISHKSDKIPVVTDSLTKHRDVYEHNHRVPNLDLLTDKQKSVSYEPVKIGPVVAHDAFGFSVEVDSLTKKEKQAAIYDVYEPSKEEPIKTPLISSNELELPVLVNSLSKKDNTVKVEPVVPYGTLEHPAVIDSFGKKDKPIKIGSTDFYGAFELPAVDSLGKKEPIKQSVTSYDELKLPEVVDSLTKKDKPVTAKPATSYYIYEPVIKEKPVIKETAIMFLKDLFHPGKESMLTKENAGDFNIPVVEALSFEQDIENNETPKQELATFDEIHGFNEPEVDSFDETGDHGSGMEFDGSDFARSSLPVNSNKFSMVTNIKEQERRQFKSCVTPKNEVGNCLPFQLCLASSAVNSVDELLRNVCIIDDVFLGVCCPEFPVETVRVDWEQLKPNTDMLNEEKSSQISKECGKLPSMVTDRDPWPWMALLIARSSGKIFCGGALISEQYVLTAAHCTIRIPRNQILVRLGHPTSENRSEPDFEVIEIKRHSGYNRRTMQNDIALLKLSRRVEFGDFRRVVCLPKDEEGIDGLISESASLLRWKETPGEIKDVESLSVISNRECQNRMQTVIADSIICTEPRTDETMCNADSGAPLLMSNDDKFEVIGILTWNRNDCDERFPTVFTRVSRYHRWIEKLAS